MRELNCPPIDLLHQGADGVIGVYLLETDDGPALFDTGPATCYEQLREQVDVEELRISSSRTSISTMRARRGCSCGTTR